MWQLGGQEINIETSSFNKAQWALAEATRNSFHRDTSIVQGTVLKLKITLSRINKNKFTSGHTLAKAIRETKQSTDKGCRLLISNHRCRRTMEKRLQVPRGNKCQVGILYYYSRVRGKQKQLEAHTDQESSLPTDLECKSHQQRKKTVPKSRVRCKKQYLLENEKNQRCFLNLSQPNLNTSSHPEGRDTHSPRVTVGEGSFSMALETLSAFSGTLFYQ